MLRANKTNFKDTLKAAVRHHHGYVDPNKQRAYWWTHHQLESTPNNLFPAPHTLLYDGDFNRNDPSLWVLDLSHETVLGAESIQLEPLDLSLKNIPEGPQRRAKEFLKMLLSSDNNLKISKELEIVPINQGEKTERGLQVSQLNQKGQHNINNRTSYSPSAYAVDSSLIHGPHPQKRSTENVTNKKFSGRTTNAGKKSQTLTLPPQPPEPRPLQSSSQVFSDAKGVEYAEFLKQYGELYEHLISQQQTPSMTTRSQHSQTFFQDKSIPSTSCGFVSLKQAPENCIDHAMILRPPITQTGNSSGFALPSLVPQRAYEATVVPGKYHGYSTQSSPSALMSPLYSTSAGQQSSYSHMMPPQPKVQATTSAMALQSYPSFPTSAKPSSAPMAKQAPDNFIDPAMIRRPLVKRNQTTGNSSDFTLPSVVPQRASEATLAPGKYEYSAQSTARAVTSPVYSNSAGRQSSSSHMMSPQSKVQATTPAMALQSCPSLSSAAVPSSAPTASKPYSRSNLRWHPYPQRASATTPSPNHSVSKPSTTPVPSSSATTTRYHSFYQGSPPEHHNSSAKRDDAESGSTFTTEGSERANTPLQERWLKQQFANVIDNPGECRVRK